MIKLAALELPLARLLKTKMEERENLLLGNKLVLAGKALIFLPAKCLAALACYLFTLVTAINTAYFSFCCKECIKT